MKQTTEGKGIIETIRSKIKDWCLDYMADCNSDIEFNRPSPPIWEYLDKKLQMLKEKNDTSNRLI